METILILFSGLAGTGKSTLANALARELKIPVISFDYFMDHALPRHVIGNPGSWTNQDVFEMMSKLAEQQLSLGVSVIMDAVYFSRESRDSVRAVAEKYRARFRVIHAFCSNKELWRERVVSRANASAPEETPAQWDTIMAELDEFHPWNQDEALFVDSIHPIDQNIRFIRNFLVESKDTG
jgi:predicted kinase